MQLSFIRKIISYFLESQYPPFWKSYLMMIKAKRYLPPDQPLKGSYHDPVTCKLNDGMI